MKALLIVAHGSPRAEANDAIRRTAEAVRERHVWPIVLIGYLDCNEPDIPSAVDHCIKAGATEITAVPCFLHSGRHFLIDLPALLIEAERRHSGVIIRMGDYVGRQPQIAGIVRDRLNTSISSE